MRGLFLSKDRLSYVLVHMGLPSNLKTPRYTSVSITELPPAQTSCTTCQKGTVEALPYLDGQWDFVSRLILEITEAAILCGLYVYFYRAS